VNQYVCLLLVCLWGTAAVGQPHRPSGKLPEELRPSLQKRLAIFTQAQADGRWEEVSNLLGRYRRGGTGDHPYTSVHKACLVSQMQTQPMVEFTFSFENILHSTEILSMPAASRWWYLAGEATFRSQSGELTKQQTQVVAYRDQNQWYFTPPNYDSYWEKSHITDADFSIDRADEIQVENNPKCPLEIREVHVFMDKQHPSLRDVKFALRNKTSRKVKGFTVRLYDKGGSVIYAAGADMKSNEQHSDKMNTSAYVYFCDGIQKQRFVVDSVYFADGSEWQRKRPIE
jgi:hypothetical protein